MQTQRTRINSQRAEALLFPIAAFLRAGGLSKKSALGRLAAAYDHSQSLGGMRRIEHIGHPMLYADIVAAWGHDARFLDSAGRPRALRFEGRDELRSLVRSVDPKCDAHAALRVLMKFGNVRKNRNGTYRLIRPLFFTATSNSMAFEPMAFFLSDASATLTRILRRTKRTRGPELFWRKVECSGISASDARRFVSFVRERGQEFLEEIDDWLESRSEKGATSRKRTARRVGLGLFSIDSNA